MLRSLLLVLLALTHPSFERDVYHKVSRSSYEARKPPPMNVAEVEPAYWARQAEGEIGRLAQRLGGGGGARARNVVMFLGDGMSVPTLAAARTLLGQRSGRTGEESHLSFEEFPTVGLSKTYCVDAQIADSACTATAYLCGTKANRGTLGVSAAVPRWNCAADHTQSHAVHSIAALALQDGRDAGIVTTTRVTHASPAGAYAHSATRDWESDADVREDCAHLLDDASSSAGLQPDIAYQLVNSYPGKDFKVILGGGRREFLPSSVVDEEGTQGRRHDGRNLIEEWQQDKMSRNVSYQYVWNRDQLQGLSSSPPEYLLGLFEGSHMQYHMESNDTTEPTLEELTEVAIRSLSRNERGFFLFVEGGRIDHAHHDNLVHLALDETIEMSKAVARAAELLDEEDSLIVVTSDHAHVMTFNGYSGRGRDILGPSDDLGDDNVPYMTLTYANGPGFRPHVAEGVREDITKYDYHDVEFQYPAAVPLDSETHGGDDVGVFALGVHNEMFAGMYEQSQIPHRMAYAACIGPGLTACSDQQELFNSL